MAIQISDDGNTIKIVKDGKEYFPNKRQTRVTGDTSTETIYIHESGSQVVEIPFTDVTSPVEASYTDLINFIQNLLDTTVGGGGGGDATAANQTTMIGLIDGILRTTSITNTSTSGTVAAGAYSVSILNDGATAGTVKGVSFPRGVSVTFKGDINDTLDAIAYDATGTTFIITTVV